MKTIFIAMSALMLSACSNILNIEDINSPEIKNTEWSLHQHVSQLARQLFMNSNNLQFNETIAVGSFLPIENLSGKNMPPSATLGQQIQESMVTLATQSGMNVIEFKTTNNLKLESNLDIMLSRDIDKINKNITIDFFLTGTYAFSKAGLVVNARLIDVTNSNIMAAATDIIPVHVVQGLTGGYYQPVTNIETQLYFLN